jgi:hypothetical protein
MTNLGADSEEPCAVPWYEQKWFVLWLSLARREL